MTDLTPDERRCLAEALLTWRYLNHGFASRGGIVTEESERRAYAALRIAKALGVRDEYLTLVFEHPVLRVSVLEYDDHSPLKTFVGDVPARKKRRKM